MPTHDSESDPTTDDCATVQVTYALDSSIAGQNGKVASDAFIQLVFGGHLAASGTPPTSPRG